MPKLLLVVLLAPLLLAAVVLVAPFACLYFLFDRLCDCIEEFRPRNRRRTKDKPTDRAAQLGKLLDLYSKRGPNPTNDNKGRHSSTEPAL